MTDKRIWLEDSSGKVIQDPTEHQIKQMIMQIGGEIDHCILNVGETFIQASGKKNELFAEVEIGSGKISSDRADYSPEDVYQMFMSFLNDEDTWRDHFTTVSFSGSSEFSRPSTPGKTEQKPKFDIKKEAGKALQQEGRYVARRQVRRGISGILSIITGLFIRKKLKK